MSVLITEIGIVSPSFRLWRLWRRVGTRVKRAHDDLKRAMTDVGIRSGGARVFASPDWAADPRPNAAIERSVSQINAIVYSLFIRLPGPLRPENFQRAEGVRVFPGGRWPLFQGLRKLYFHYSLSPPAPSKFYAAR